MEAEVGPFADISADVWSNALNTKVFDTILTTQQLVPLVEDFHSRILLLTPSIIPSLRPPHHAIASTVGSALEGFSASLAAELRLQDLYLSHLKLGSVEIPGSRKRLEGTSGSKTKGTPMRKLQDTVFDALKAKRPSAVYHVGRGSLTYSVVGNWLPTGLVGMMMGFRKTQGELVEEGESQDDGSDSSMQWEKVDQRVV